jgi:dipeptidyl aminopeptidase/acylaminoacyl peptidase
MRGRRILAAIAVAALLLGGCSADESELRSGDQTSASARGTPDPGPGPTSSTGGADDEGSAGPDVTGRGRQAEEREPAARPVSVLGLAEQRHRGDRLRLGAVRERTPEYTSYDVTYRSRTTTRRGEESYTISGVLNVPNGRGDFPAVVLAHGYIDPAVYVRGQGMTRERGYLAARGYIALHVDYRNHAESDDDPRLQARMRLGYSADVINAVKALRGSPDVPVDDDRVSLFGRSMGGGVILKALVAEPGLVGAASLWGSVSSLERENYDQFIRPDPEDAGLRDQLARRYGTPEQDPRFWRENSSRPYFDRITEPVLLVHGRYDDTCPPRWATATQRALREAGVSSELEWYADGHAFGPAFNAAMNRTVRFFDRRLGRGTASPPRG